MAYSILNLLNFTHLDSIHLHSIFILLCCVMFRDTLAFFNKNSTYIISSLALFGFAFFAVDFLPVSFDVFSLVGLLSSPILFFSLVVRMFDVIDEQSTMKI